MCQCHLSLKDDEVKTNVVEPLHHVLSKDLKEIHVSNVTTVMYCSNMIFLLVSS